MSRLTRMRFPERFQRRSEVGEIRRHAELIPLMRLGGVGEPCPLLVNALLPPLADFLTIHASTSIAMSGGSASLPSGLLPCLLASVDLALAPPPIATRHLPHRHQDGRDPDRFLPPVFMAPPLGPPGSPPNLPPPVPFQGRAWVWSWDTRRATDRFNAVATESPTLPLP